MSSIKFPAGVRPVFKVKDTSKVVIVDIDDTLLRNGDEPIKDTIAYVNDLADKYFIAVVTGRPADDREKTASALRSAGVRFNSLTLNSLGISSPEYKKKTAERIMQNKDVVMAIENGESAQNAYRSLGIKVKSPSSLPNAVEKHGHHDQSTHGNWAHGFSEEISNWDPHSSIPDSPRNAGGMTRKMWDAWEHGPDGQPFVELFRKYACEELGLEVPKTPYDRGGYSAFMLNRGWGAPNRNEAKAMLNAIANGSDQPTLYRGLAKPTFTDDSSSDVALFNRFVTMKSGDRFDMPLASTTRSLGVAAWYAADRVEQSTQNMIIKIQSGAKGVSLKKEGSYYPQDYEVITSGKFEVVNIDKVSAPYWKRGVFEPRKTVYTDGTEHYEVATYSPKRYSIEESKKIYDAVKNGNVKSLETKDFKLTNDRGGDGMTLSSWERQPAKEFTVVEVKMVEPHTVQKSQDFGNDFFYLFNTVPFIREDTNVTKHGNHDQRSHGNWATGMMSESELMASYKGHELTAAQDEAVGRYLATGHRVNELVRSGQLEHYLTDETKVSDVVNGLDSAIESSPSLPKGELFRVVSADAILRLKRGDVINDKGFMSTTAADLLNPDNGNLLLHLATVSSGRKSIMVIKNNEGKKGMFMPAVKAGQPIAEHEREVVLPRNTKLKYVGEEYHFIENGLLTYYKFERQ